MTLSLDDSEISSDVFLGLINLSISFESESIDWLETLGVKSLIEIFFRVFPHLESVCKSFRLRFWASSFFPTRSRERGKFSCLVFFS